MKRTLTKEQSLRLLKAVKTEDTKPEMVVRHFLHGFGFRYSLNHHGLPGSPDIVLKKYRTVIFVNGCFWHHHEGCKYSRIPVTNTTFWHRKFHENIARDERVFQELRKFGWRVLVIWECQVRKKQETAEFMYNLVKTDPFLSKRSRVKISQFRLFEKE